MAEDLQMRIEVFQRDALRAVDEFRSALERLSDQAEDTGSRIDDSFRNASDSVQSLAGKLAEVGGAFIGMGAIKNFVNQVYHVRESFQDAESTLKVFLGSAEEGKKFFNELKDYAWYNMFEFDELLQGTNQLIAYGNATKDIIPIMDKLSNVAAATQRPLGQYIDMWNRAKSTGFVDSRSMMSWASSGIVLKDVLAGIGEEVDGSRISFEQLGKAIEAITGPGGQFFGTMNAQMSNLSAAQGQLQDDWKSMLNEIGEQYQDIFKSSIMFADGLIEHYRAIGKALAALIATYGSYRAALLLVRGVEMAKGFAESVRLIVMLRKELGLATAAQQAFNLASKANVYVALASAVIGVVSALVMFRKRTEEAEDATEGLTDAQRDSITASQKEIMEMQNLFTAARDESRSLEERKNLIMQINNEYGSYLSNLLDETSSVTALASAYATVAEKMADKHIAQKREEILTEPSQMMAETISKYGGTGNALGAEQFAQAQMKMEQAFSNFATNAAEEDWESFEHAMEEALNIYYGNSEKSRTAEIEGLKEVASAYRKGIQDFGAYERAYKKAVGTLYSTGDKITTSVKAVTETIEKCQQRISELQAQAVEGLTDDQKKELEEVQSKLSSATKEYQTLTGSSYGADEKERQKAIERSAEERQKAITQFGEDVSKMFSETERNITQARIDAMEDGEEKTNLIFEMELKNNMKQAEKLKEVIDELYGDDPKYANDPQRLQMVKMYEELIEKIKEYNKLLKDNKELSESQKVVDDADQIASRYQSVNDRRLEMNRRYYEDEEKLFKAYQQTGNEYYLRSLKERKDAWLKELDDLDMQESDIYKDIFRDIETMSVDSIKRAIEDAEAEIVKLAKQGPAAANKIKTLRDRVTELKAAKDEIDFGGWGSGLDTVIQKMIEMKRTQELISALERQRDTQFSGVSEDNEDLKELNSRIKNAKESLDKMSVAAKRALSTTLVTQFGNALGKAADNMRTIAELSENPKMLETAQTWEDAASVLSSVASGAASGGWIGALVGAATSIGSLITESFGKNKIYMEELAAAQEKFQHNLKMSALTLDASDYESIFGADVAQRAADAYANAQVAFEDYTNTVISTKAVDPYTELYNSFSERYRNKVDKKTGKTELSEEYDLMLRAAKKGFNDLQAMMVKVQDRSWLANKFGGRDKFTLLGDLVPELFDEDGMLNVENAKQALIDYANELDDTQKKLLNNAIDSAEAYKAAMDEVKQYASSMLGDFAGNLGNAICNAILSGKDAMDDISKIGANVIDNFARSMASSFMLSSYLKNFEDDLSKAFATNDTESMTQIMGNIMEGLPTAVEATTTMVKGIYDMAEEAGMDIDSLRDSTRQAVSANSLGASQDSVDESNGRLTAIQGHTSQIMTDVTAIRALNTQIVSTVSDILAQVMGIHSDTTEMSDQLNAIQDSTNALQDSTNEIRGYLGRVVDKGVKVY